MSTSLLQLCRNIAKAGYGYATGAPSATGLTTTIVDTSADSPLDTGDSATLFVNSWVKITADSAGSPTNVGEVQRVTTYAPSTGTLTVGRAFSATTKTTQTYDIYQGVPPTRQGMNKGLDEYINDVLRRLFYRRTFLLTLITDGDMETSGVTNWTASNATLTKSTTTGVIVGKQALRVLNTVAGGYAQSPSVSVEASQIFNVAVDVSVVSGTATLELWDVTNGASIKTTTSNEKETRRIWFSSGTLPSGCMQVAVRLKGTEVDADIYWDNLSLMNQAATEMPMPSWFKDPKWLERVTIWWAGPTATAGTDRAIDAQRRKEAQWWGIQEDVTGYTPYKVVFEPHSMASTHLFAQALCPYSELSSDSDTTDADPDWVKAWTLVYIARDKGDKALAERWLPEAKALDKLYQPTWRGKRYQMGALY